MIKPFYPLTPLQQAALDDILSNRSYKAAQKRWKVKDRNTFMLRQRTAQKFGVETVKELLLLMIHDLQAENAQLRKELEERWQRTHQRRKA
jgi:hypothetical protein